MGRKKMSSLIELSIESGKFRCLLNLVIKCPEDISMYVKFVSHEQVKLQVCHITMSLIPSPCRGHDIGRTGDISDTGIHRFKYMTS